MRLAGSVIRRHRAKASWISREAGIIANPLDGVAGKVRFVPEDCRRIGTAREIGIALGD